MHIPGQINALNYLGSKYSLLPWLLPKLKETKSFVELFGGSMVVTINRKPSPIETYNDINENIVNFFRVLRDQPEELRTLLYLTPHSRYEYEHAWNDNNESDIERARRFYVRLKQSFMASGAQKEVKGWLSATKESRCRISEATSKYLNGIDSLELIVERIRRVQIECRPYEWVLSSYDTEETLFYADPPYDSEKRSSASDYENDFTEQQHVELRDRLSKIEGLFAVSGYDSDFMKSLYKDFYFTPGPSRKNNYSKKKGVRECLWSNYDPYHCNLKTSLFH